MTNEQINIAIAGSLGWRYFCDSRKYFKGINGYPPDYKGDINKEKGRKEIPDYCNDLNAMHKVIKTLRPVYPETDWRLWEQYVAILGDQFTGSEDVAFADAGQQAEAYLRTLGKWEAQ